jgi:hypothetical protein
MFSSMPLILTIKKGTIRTKIGRQRDKIGEAIL